MKRIISCLMVTALMLVSPVVFAQQTFEEELGRIIVTATRIGQHDYKITGNVTVIDRDQIEASNAQSVPDVLKEALGVSISDNSTTKTSKLDIRGFGETAVSSVLFLVNDRKTNSIDMSGSDLVQIPIESVERIEIIRGAGSVLYGDNAVGGVVNIITKKGEGYASGQVGVSYGSYDKRATNLEVSGEKNNISYYVSSKYTDERGYRQNSDMLAKDFNGRFGYKFSDKISLDVETGWHEDDYGQPGSLTEAQLISLGRRGSPNEDDTAATRDRFINFSFDVNPWPENMDFGKLIVDVSYRNRDAYTDNVAWSSTTKNQIDTKGVNAKYTFDKTIFDKEVNFVTGIDYYDNEHEILREASSTTELVISKEEFGIYGFLEYELIDDVFINGGTRFHKAEYNFNQRNGTADDSQDPDKWVSMAGIKYEYAKGSNIYANVQETFRFLATDEWFNTISGVLNSDLKQQEGMQYEIGLKHNFNDKVELNVTPYVIDIENEIYYNPTGGNFGWGANENYDKTRRIGVEVGSRFNILKFFDLDFFNDLEFFTNYTYQNPQFQKGDYDGEDIPLVPRHQAGFGIIAKFLESYNFSVLGRYVGTRFVGSDTANALTPLKPHFIVDGKLAYTKKNMEVYAEVNNIFNEEYSTYVSSWSTTKYYYPAPEMNFNFGVNLKF
ncbi:MAG: TonB-dependent receptor [Candidatus Omnitrophica bacterium]|nr:TonB-dependent receptor [Candidatus Omnitrophota bacterium]